MNEHLIWTDLETFGLNPETDPIIEVGFIVTDLDLNILDEKNWLIWNISYESRYTDFKEQDNFVYKMHEKSKLWQDAREAGQPAIEVEHSILQWLTNHKVDTGKDPLCGSSVHFDRSMFDAQLPRILIKFSYRNIDVSSIKELCMRYNPVLYGKLDESVPKAEQHRVLPDLSDTIAEFNFYKENFLFIEMADA